MQPQHRFQPELLAPAGDETCMRAAVVNGADAVYFGLESLNARRRAANFTLAALPETVAYLHRHNVKGYVALNTLVFSDELPRAAEIIRRVIEAGTDALIVQDLGIMRLIREMSSTFPIHASTQATQTHAAGIDLLADFGVSRVILARELSVAEIAAIARQTGAELEVFVHGAMCISYSGQCLASEWLFDRSGNRGECAQACRLPYQLVVDGKIANQPGGDHLLSPRDMAACDRIGELLAAGVTGFKIEGRLKSAEYVASITAIYRDALDAAVAGRSFKLSAAQREELDQSFSRGFARGFLDGDRHQDLINPRSPKSRGVRVGSVVGKTRRGVVVRIEPPATLKPGDGVVFEGDDPEAEQGGRVYEVAPQRRSAECEATFGRGDLDLRRVHVGAVVFKSDDPAVRRRVEARGRRERVLRPVAIDACVSAKAGEPLSLTLTDTNGNAVTLHTDRPLEHSHRHPLTIALLREQLSRLGDTPFVLAEVALLTTQGEPAGQVEVMAPKSVLNDLRRRAVAELMRTREHASRHTIEHADALDRLRRDRLKQGEQGSVEAGKIPVRHQRLHVLARTLEQVSAVRESASSSGAASIETVYGEFENIADYASAAKRATGRGVAFGIALPQILKPGEERWLDDLTRLRPAVVLVRNLASLALVRQRLPDARPVGDFSLNVANELTAAMLAGAGFARITPGHDLDARQLAALADAAPTVEVEPIAYGRVPMFHMAHCIAAARLGESQSCERCSRPCVQHTLALQDRNGERHPVRLDALGRTTVLASRPRNLLTGLPPALLRTVHHWRIELFDEDRRQTADLIERYRSQLT